MYVFYAMHARDALQIVLSAPSSAARADAIHVGELHEASARGVREQVRRIDLAMARDPLIAGDFASVAAICDEYDALVEQTAVRVAPELLAGPSRRRFAAEIGDLRQQYTSRSGVLGARSSARRAAASVAVPARPSTAPPSTSTSAVPPRTSAAGRAARLSASPLHSPSPLHLSSSSLSLSFPFALPDADMPDLSFFDTHDDGDAVTAHDIMHI